MKQTDRFHLLKINAQESFALQIPRLTRILRKLIIDESRCIQVSSLPNLIRGSSLLRVSIKTLRFAFFLFLTTRGRDAWFQRLTSPINFSRETRPWILPDPYPHLSISLHESLDSQRFERFALSPDGNAIRNDSSDSHCSRFAFVPRLVSRHVKHRIEIILPTAGVKIHRSLEANFGTPTR